MTENMTDAIAYAETPTPEKYAVVWALPDGRIEYPTADWVRITDDGHLLVERRLPIAIFGPAAEPIAIWAPGAWERAEITEETPEPVALQLTDTAYTPEALSFAADVIVGVMGHELEPGPIADLVDQLRLDADGAEPEEPAGPGTFEVYEDHQGKFRFRLKAANGEVIASSQAYASRGGARQAVGAVVRAAKGARIVDLDSDR